MGLPAEIAEKLEPLISRARYEEAIQLLEERLPTAEDVDEITLLTRKLAHLYRFGKLTGTLALTAPRKAISYALLAGQSYVRAGRLAPAVAMLKWIRECPESESSAEQLHRLISETFSQPQKKTFQADDALPIPSGFQKIKAFVSFEEEGPSVSRQQWAESAPRRATLFSSLKPQEVARLVSCARVRELSPGSVLFREGDKPLAFYIVADGEMQLESNAGVRRVFGEGEFFGELALLGRMQRTATLKTKDGAKLLEFSEADLQACMSELPQLEHRIMSFYELRLFLNVALRSALFRGFSDPELTEVWEFLTSIRVPAGRILIEQGTPSDRFFFLIRGYCEVLKGGVSVSRLGPGQFIGEIGLIHKSVRTAQVVALSECHLLECHELVFEDLCKRFPKIKKICEETAALRDPAVEITDKIVVD